MPRLSLPSLQLVAIPGKVATGWSGLSKDPTNRLVVGLGSQAGIDIYALKAPILLRLVIPSEPSQGDIAALEQPT